MTSSAFKKHTNLGDSSNFDAWKVRLEIIDENNSVLENIQGTIHEPPENYSASLRNRNKKGESNEKKIIVDGLQDNLLAYVGNLRNV